MVNGAKLHRLWVNLVGQMPNRTIVDFDPNLLATQGRHEVPPQPSGYPIDTNRFVCTAIRRAMFRVI